MRIDHSEREREKFEAQSAALIAMLFYHGV